MSKQTSNDCGMLKFVVFANNFNMQFFFQSNKGNSLQSPDHTSLVQLILPSIDVDFHEAVRPFESFIQLNETSKRFFVIRLSFLKREKPPVRRPFRYSIISIHKTNLATSLAAFAMCSNLVSLK